MATTGTERPRVMHIRLGQIEPQPPMHFGCITRALDADPEICRRAGKGPRRVHGAGPMIRTVR